MVARPPGPLDETGLGAEKARVTSHRTILRVALALLLVAVSQLSFADVGQRLPLLAALRAEALRSKGALAYVPLRRIWQEWDRGDPAEVETTLESLASDASLAPAHRAYAGLLEAYARRRRGDLGGCESRIAKLGYVGSWLVLGPFDNEGKTGMGRLLDAEKAQLRPIDMARTHLGKERYVGWRRAPEVSPNGWFDFGVLLRPEEKICAIATTFVRDARPKERGKARTISVFAGSAGAMRVYWNGAELFADEKYRALDADRFAANATLEPGENQLFVKVCGDERPPMLALRLGAADGGPDANLEVSSDPARSRDLAHAKATKPVFGRVEGAVSGFERLVRGHDPAVLEAYARYLSITQSDDPSEHRARDLATEAADRAPTIPRLLLASELVEHRSQRAQWIERAEALARGKASDDDRLAVLLARAAHARTGPNWRDAVPFYDRALAIEKDDVIATLARVELYDEAGLHATAASFLGRALERRPRSVALLRAMAAALHALDRQTEADEVADRYAALRFDDPSVMKSHLEFAVGRRDRAAVERWAGRLIAASPDSSQALFLAARAFTAMGERHRAIALGRRALELAPEDTDAMQKLAEIFALAGQSGEQLRLLKRVLELRPQNKAVREYVSHSEPARPRPDESYAIAASEFLKHRDAPAAGQLRRTLVELQVTTVYANGLAGRFRQVVFQPLTDGAATEARDYYFGFEANTEVVQLRGARVYRASGQIDEGVETRERPANNPAIAMYTSARIFHVRFPRLAPGDVVELLYRVEDVAERNAFADYFGEIAYLQSDEPIDHAEYVLITPKSRTFHFNEPRVPNLQKTVEETKDERVFRFRATNVPPVRTEPRQPALAGILGHVHVSTYQSWDAMGQWYWGLAKDQFVADEALRRRTLELTKGLNDDRAKVRAIYDFVVQSIRYVALEFGIHGYKPYRAAQAFARGFGDCKDKATLIVTMLRELRIDATIVLVRTSQRGDIEPSPASLAAFDHAIAYVPSLDLYLDGTAEDTGSTELPPMDRGSLALQINEGKPKLVTLPDAPPEASVLAEKIVTTLAPDGSAQLEWRAEATGAHAAAWRQRYQAKATRPQRLTEALVGRFHGVVVGAVDTNELSDVEQPVTVRTRGRVPALGRRDDGTWTVPAGPAEHLVREYATLSARTRDIRLAARTVSDTDWTVRLPAGARVVRAPQPSEGTSPFGSYRVQVDTAAGSVRVHTTITLAKSRISVAEYGAFRAFCEAADQALGQRVAFSVR